MKKRSLFSILAVAVLAWGASAPAARAAGVPLDTLLNTTFAYGGLNFTFDSYANTGGAPAAADVIVTFIGAGTGEVGFTLTAAFGAGVGVNSDANLVYEVSGAPLIDAMLTGNPSLNVGNTGGLAAVSETLYPGAFPGSVGNPPIGNLFIQNSPPGPLIDSLTFAAQDHITVVKDIEAHGGTTGVALSFVGQTFSVVPEPTSMSLLGIGIAGFFAFRRFFKRPEVH